MPPVFWYSDRILLGTAVQEYEIWCIDWLEISVLVVMCFLDSSLDGVNISKVGDSRISSETYCIICPFTEDYVWFIYSIHLLQVVRASVFDATK